MQDMPRETPKKLNLGSQVGAMYRRGRSARCLAIAGILHKTTAMGYLDGKVALVVGGSGGIGAAICRRLSSEGASCVVTWHTGKDAAVAVAGDCGNESTAVKLDCSDVAQCKAVVEAVVEEKTKIDILVLSSGILTGGWTRTRRTLIAPSHATSRATTSPSRPPSRTCRAAEGSSSLVLSSEKARRVPVY